ncbi:MAG: hypothetical protein Q8K18_16955 [Burkholderiales bacterium]|nr:hypothetical protein [Burkholderiales bacterium]
MTERENSVSWEYISSIPGIAWPAIAAPGAAQLLALQFQFERSQWLGAGQIHELQLGQLGALARHAFQTVPYYRQRWQKLYDPGVPLTAELLAQLPLLARRDLQDNSYSLKSTAAPTEHGPAVEGRTSGSTGSPVRSLKNGLTSLFWRAFALRDHRWHGRDLGGKLAAIRQGAPDAEAESWGQVTNGVLATGRSSTLDIRASIDTQLRWLAQQQPAYLLSYPSNIAGLARQSLARGIRFPGLREVRTIGEVLTPETRALCRQAWDVPVTDAYSADEVGYIALQCPVHEHYHVQSEGLLVEVIDEQGAACAPGAVGRVVVTALHNFAMPLVRYAIGDYAEVGAPCACGRGLPVLKRIMGRVRNMLILANGESYWPMLGTQSFPELAPILQHQFVQKSPACLELRLVTARTLSPREEDNLRKHIESRLPVPMQLNFVYCGEISRGKSGKFEDFVSEMS